MMLLLSTIIGILNKTRTIIQELHGYSCHRNGAEGNMEETKWPWDIVTPDTT